MDKIFINRDGLQISYSKVLVDIPTKYQRLRILQTEKFGKIIILDDIMFQAEQGDELTEMVVHLPLNVGPKKKTILAIGAGDGFALKEIIKHDYLERIDIVEIDGMLLEKCKKIFPFKRAWNDKRVRITIQDGFEFLKTLKNNYDLIISTPANTYTKDGDANIAFKLFDISYFKLVNSSLSDEGIFITDGSTSHYAEKEPNWISIYKDLKKIFPIVYPYFFTSKRMPGGSFVLVFASKKYLPIKNFQLNMKNLKTNYYNAEIHKAAFCLPEFLRKNL